jgi:hypothetical protein
LDEVGVSHHELNQCIVRQIVIGDTQVAGDVLIFSQYIARRKAQLA